MREEYVPNENMRYNQKKQRNKMEISNFPDKEFQVVVIKMLIGLEKE